MNHNTHYSSGHVRRQNNHQYKRRWHTIWQQLHSWLFYVIVGLALPALATEPPSLEQLLQTRLNEVKYDLDVETSGRMAQNSRQHGNLTYIISAHDIQMFGMRTLADILDFFPGLYVSRDPAFSYVGIRGLGQPNDYNSRLLFLLDGIRLNEAIFDAGLLGTDAIIDIENIDRVEFSAGPGAAVYGNNAFFGVIQIFSKTASAGASKLDVSIGSNNNERYHLSAAQRYADGNEIYGSISHENFSQLWLGIEPPAEFGSAFQQISGEQVNRFRLGGKFSGLQLQALVSRQRRHLPGSLSNVELLSLNRAEDQNHGSMFSARHQTSGQLWQLSTAISISENHFSRREPFLDLSTMQTDAMLDSRRSRWSAVQLLWQYDGWQYHQLMTGLERHHDIKRDISVWRVSNDELLQQINQDNLRHSWFAQDTWQLSDQHYLAAGIRYDHSDNHPGRWSPRASWSWQISPSTNLKLQHGTAFRNANHYEEGLNLALQQPPPNAERIKSSELSIEHLYNKQIGMRFTLFRADIEQLILFNGLFFNAIPLHSHGTELTAQWHGAAGQQLSLGWSWQQSNFAGLSPLNSPRHLGKVRYQQALWQEAIKLSISAQSRSGRWSTYSYLPGYAHWQLGLHWQASPRHQITLQLQNMLDKSYQHQPLTNLPALEQPGRTVWFNWRWLWL